MGGDVVNAPHPEMWNVLYAHMWELWIGPAVEERGSDLTPETVRKVVVELPPGGPVSVRLDEEASIEARFTSTRAIPAGEDVFLEDIAELHGVRPTEVGENSGWICYLRLPDGRTWIAFDFTYNRARARTLMERAAEFFETAQDRTGTSLAVCLDNAFSTAELAVQAEMLVMQQETDNHKVRGRWLAGWSENGNSPSVHATTLWRLADLRKKARYGFEPVAVTSAELSKLLDIVEDMLERARARIELPAGHPYSDSL